ncbi:leucine-rich repeat flightless-interacting protein 1 isoform X2 [Brienomyrus brachyistius]|uniref:leucine-rich repeat flightless-interacting protein 1 isoform X2 n=1 Tax=Brienomyrus brachyistius TaxID=42636 RepID=UPI0020B1A63E|nr:leucine-rich repeat flightless-interacting protein 1 isoform X2 [Brienomyrus brachyistius]
MGTQDTGRKRMPNRERLTAEDDALNLIAREAEARLAAKRAARAEAREIRMKELEWQQNEISDDEERMSVGSRGSLRVEDRDKDHLEKGSRAASTLASLSRASSRRGSGDASNWADPETSVREMKDSVLEVEQKYRKAMVFNAQLDNEKSKLMYQVDVLKDSLMELEEQLSESRREHEEKSKALERERHAHNILQFQFSELKEMLKQSEELLTENRKLSLKQDGYVREIADLQETLEWKDKKIGALERQKEFSDAIQNERDDLRNEVFQLRDTLKKHGIVLGPDLNANGETEGVIDRLANTDSATRSAKDSQPSQTGGDSMLGKATEGQMEGKELQEGGSRELVAKAENHIDEQQRQREEAESLEGSAAESAQQNQGEREPSSPIPCSQASAPPTGNPERAQSDSLMGSGLEMHYSQHNSEANFVAQDNYELNVLNGTEGSITREEEGGDNGVGNADLVDGGISSTEGQTASLEGGTGIENRSGSTADGNHQDNLAAVNQESSDKTGDMESESESVRDVMREDESNQTSDGTRDANEEAGAAASVGAEPQPSPAESTDKDQKEECPKESTLIEGGDETAEKISVNLKHETADVVLEPKEKQKKGKGVKTAQQQAKRKGTSEKVSAQAVTTSSQPEDTAASGKKKKRKKKAKQKQKLAENPEEAKQVDEEEQEKVNYCTGTTSVKELETDHWTVDPSAEECQTETVEETEIKTLNQALQDDEMVDKEEKTEQEGGNHSEVLESKNVEECHLSTDILAGGIGIKHEEDKPSESSSLQEEEISKALGDGIKHANVENTFSLEAFTDEPIGSDFPKEAQIPQEDLSRSDCYLKAEGNVQEIEGAQDNLIKYGTESEGALLEGTETEEMDSCEEAEVLVKEHLSEHHKEDHACSEDVELQERVDAQSHVTVNKELAADVLVKDNVLEREVTGQTEHLFEEENDSCEEPPECIIEEGAELTDSQNTESTSVELTVPNQVEMVNPSISEKYDEGESKLEEVDLQPKELEDDDDEEGGESFQFDDDLGLDLEASNNTITSRPHEDNSLEEISTNEGNADEDKEAMSGENPDSRAEKESGNGQCQDPSIRSHPDVQDEGNSSADVLGTMKVEQMSDGSQSVLDSVEEGEEAVAFVGGSHSNEESQPTEEPPEGSEEQVDAGSAKGSKKGKGKGKEDCRMA